MITRPEGWQAQRRARVARSFLNIAVVQTAPGSPEEATLVKRAVEVLRRRTDEELAER